MEANFPSPPQRAILTAGWFTRPESQQLMALLEAGGATPRYVGGSVRDALLERETQDVDIAVTLPPNAILTLLEQAGIRALTTGITHGTVTAVVEGKPYEITTLRRDTACDGRHASVAFTDSWREDAARRDFTMNALYADSEGRLYDYFGGWEDAKAGRVRFIGEAAQRITEDYLRILRFFRFYAGYGKGAPDVEALAACNAHRDGIARLSGERIHKEMFRLLATPNPLPALRALEQSEVWETVLPPLSFAETAREAEFQHLLALERALSLTPEAMTRLALMLRAAASPAAAFATLAERWRCSTTECKAQEALMRFTPLPLSQERQWQEFLRHHGWEVTRRALLLTAAEAREDAAKPKALFSSLLQWQIPVFPLTGADLLAHGHAAGPALGAELKRLEQAWVASHYTLSREELLAAKI
jgi:poly(A) polymerase